MTQFGTDRRCLPAAEQPRDGAHLLRSADQHARGEEERRAVIALSRGPPEAAGVGAVRGARRRRLYDRLPAEPPLPRRARRRTRSASARPSRSPRSPARRASSTSTSPASAGWRWRTASTISRSASRSRSTSIPAGSSSSTRSARWPPRPACGRRHRRAAMARIVLDGVAHSYLAAPRGPQDYALKRLDHVWEDGGAYALLGPSGCGKTTLLNIISGLITPSEGRVLFDGTDVTERADGGAQHRAGFPVPGDLRHDDGRARTSPSRCATARSRAPRSRSACAEVAKMLDLTADPEQAGARADRRRQAEGLARPRARQAGRDRDPLRRAAHRHRPASEMAAALEAEGAAPRVRPDHGLRHARPDRGAHLRRQGRGDVRRRGRADRHAGGSVRAAGAHLRRLLHRLARHERRAGRGRAATAHASGRRRSSSARAYAEPAGRREDRARHPAGVHPRLRQAAAAFRGAWCRVDDVGRYRVVKLDLDGHPSTPSPTRTRRSPTIARASSSIRHNVHIYADGRLVEGKPLRRERL